MHKKILTLLIIFTILLSTVPVYAIDTTRITYPTFKIALNGQTITNNSLPYPLVIYNGITYFPMTWEFSSLLGLTLAYDQTTGLSVTQGSPNANQTLSLLKTPAASRSNLATIVNYPVSINGEVIDNHTEQYPLLNINNITYFPLTWRFAVDFFDWDYQFSNANGLSILPKAKSTIVTQTDTSTVNVYPLLQTSKLPSEYSTFDQNDDTLKNAFQRDQGNDSTCWAFAANTLFELSVYKTTGDIVNFSEDHLIYNSPIPATYSSGGYFNMAAAYYSDGYGPVLETEDPYNDGKTNTTAKPKYLLTSYVELQDDLDAIKSAIYKYGGAQSSITLNNEYLKYYNRATHSYYNNDEDSVVTHDIVLIGWDDTYEGYHFKDMPSRDGAFIALNSWGSDWGDGGLFYISYDDVNVLDSVSVITDFTTYDDDITLYNYNPTGVTHYEGYEDYHYATGMNVFEADSDSELYAVSFYAPGDDTSYTVLIDSDDNGILQLVPQVTGMVSNEGYFTVTLPKTLAVEKGQTFYVAITMENPNTNFILPLEAPYPNMDYDIEANSGESFITLDPLLYDFEDITDHRENGNLALRVFAK